MKVGAALAVVVVCGLTLGCRAAGSQCIQESDCSYNGKCATGGVCECDPAWRGERCATLNLLRARPGAGLNTSDAEGALSSWGGTVTKGDDGKYHMFVAQFIKHCGFNQWDLNSRVVHAVALEADGRYAVEDVVVPVWAHNPAVVRGPDGSWVMTYVANSTGSQYEATCLDGSVVKNGSEPGIKPATHNFMITAKSPYGPWTTPVPIDRPFDDAVPAFLMKGEPNRNSNMVMAIAKDGTMTGLWRRCCSPTPKYAPPGGGGASVVFAIAAKDWKDVSTWKAGSEAVFPQLKANGYEDPHIWQDPRRTVGGSPVFHAVFHNMVGGWHKPEYNNTQVGAHAYSADGGRTWTDTGVAFNLTVAYTDGTSTTFIQRERPHIVLNEYGDPSHLVSGVTYSLLPTLPTCTIVQPIGTKTPDEAA